MTEDIPSDYHSLVSWFNLIRMMRSAGRSAGLSVVQISVVVDEHGKPILYGQPTATRLNPRESAREAINEILNLLTVREP